MPNFVLLLSGDIAEGASAKELGGRTARQAEWIAGLKDGGTFRDGGRIEDGSVRVRAPGGRSCVVDVPVDAVKSVRSWLLVEVRDLTAAVALAGSCPEAAFGDIRVLTVDG